MHMFFIQISNKCQCLKKWINIVPTKLIGDPSIIFVDKYENTNNQFHGYIIKYLFSNFCN